MPKRTDIDSILIIGAGPIIIGQACEFDYSGAQACKALREEGYRVVLVNSNPATIMTDPETADAVYIEPIHWSAIESIIARERPDALLPTMGGQTGLNCALDLARHGVLEKYNVEMIGATREAINRAEDRTEFKKICVGLGLDVPRSGVAHTMQQAMDIVAETSGNAVVAAAVLDVKTSVREGESIAAPLENHKIFPPMVVQMIAVGEESGSLDEMSAKVADFYEEDVDNAVDNLSSLLEPLIMGILGILVGGLVVAMYLPIFKLGAVV